MASSTHALTGVEKSSQRNETSYQSDVESGSTRAPSEEPNVFYPGKEAEEASVDRPSDEAIPRPDAVTPDEYPTGARLFFIVFALVMSVFLVSLDMVSFQSGVCPQRHEGVLN